jgi:hypothetical protein
MFFASLIIFLPKCFADNSQFRFRNGDLMPKEQRLTIRVAAFILPIVFGYGAYKVLICDCKLWKRHRD